MLEILGLEATGRDVGVVGVSSARTAFRAGVLLASNEREVWIPSNSSFQEELAVRFLAAVEITGAKAGDSKSPSSFFCFSYKNR